MMLSDAFKYDLLSTRGGRPENQDYALAEKMDYGLIALICDGMGGTKGGLIASSLGGQTIREMVRNSTFANPVSEVLEAVGKANEMIYRKGTQDGLTGMGTTLAMILLCGETSTIAHVGDSRVYHIRNSEILFRTDDHSVVFDLFTKGILKSEEEMKNHPMRHQVTRALGTAPYADVEVNTIVFRQGDYFFLCSDGITENLFDQDILNIHAVYQEPCDIVRKSVELASSAGRKRGGYFDNISVISIYVDIIDFS